MKGVRLQKHLRYSNTRFHLLASMGVDPTKVLRRAHRSQALLEKPRFPLTTGEAFAFGAAIEEVSGALAIGLKIAFSGKDGRWKLNQLTFSHPQTGPSEWRRQLAQLHYLARPCVSRARRSLIVEASSHEASQRFRAVAQPA